MRVMDARANTLRRPHLEHSTLGGLHIPDALSRVSSGAETHFIIDRPNKSSQRGRALLLSRRRVHADDLRDE